MPKESLLLELMLMTSGINVEDGQVLSMDLVAKSQSVRQCIFFYVFIHYVSTTHVCFFKEVSLFCAIAFLLLHYLAVDGCYRSLI